MEKFFKALSIPAKWILIIGSLVYAVWFAVENAGSIDGSFMSVVCRLIVLIVGTTLLVAVPILLLIKKDEMAKIAFLILAGYWLLSTTRSMFSYAETYTSFTNEALAVVGGVFAFIAGLCLVGVLALVVLEFALKKPTLRLFSFFVMFGVILFCFLAGLFLFILYAKMNATWTLTASFLVENLLVPALVCFGCLYFLGAPKGKGE